jgi:stage II sporulation protein R
VGKTLRMKVVIGSMLLLVMATVGVLANLVWEPTEDLSDRLIRLHILANSNDPLDQQLKLLVRDSVRLTVKQLLENVDTKEEAAQLIQDHLDMIQQVAAARVSSEGYDYPVEVHMGVYPFPHRTYGTLEVPQGDYLAVQVVIGQGRGDNWWCVLFPPLCLIEDQDTRIVPENTTQAANTEQVKVQIQYRWKFKDYLPEWLLRKGARFMEWWTTAKAN